MNTTIRTREPRDRWNTFVLGVVGVTTFLMILMSACSSSSSMSNTHKADTAMNAVATPSPPSGSNAPLETVPVSLSNAGEFGENIYDYARANDWKNANVRLSALRDAIKRVRDDVKNNSVAVDRLDDDVGALDRAVTAKDRQAAMREANQVTLDVANMTTAYKLNVPVEVARLDCYGRELEVWAQAKDADKLQATSRELRREWDALRPSVESRSAMEAKKFDALVTRVESAKTPADYSQVATSVLNEVDNLEKLFH